MFLVPIKVGGLVPKAAIEAIFGNIEGICSVNIQLLELMETDDVATALYKLAPFMKLYSLYANNFERSNKTIEVFIHDIFRLLPRTLYFLSFPSLQRLMLCSNLCHRLISFL